jgi:peptidoglycan/xylan/chitin deacetylase (PgdA/CDA1 family)
MFIYLIRVIKYVLREVIALILFIPGLLILKSSLFNKNVLFVLNYHNFSKFNNYKVIRGKLLESNVGNFDKQIGFLNNNFNFCYPTEFFEDREFVKGLNILVTFDDGYVDNFNIALPVLKKHKAKCIFFIVTNIIGKNSWLWHDRVHYLMNQDKLGDFDAEKVLFDMNKGIKVSRSFLNAVDKEPIEEDLPRLMMNWNEVKTLYDCGFKIGSHTSNHTILKFVDDESQDDEIKCSIEKLDKELSITTNLFAQPNGLLGENTLKILKKRGIKYAFSTIRGSNKQSQNKLELKRVGFNSSDSLPFMVLKMVIYMFKRN